MSLLGKLHLYYILFSRKGPDSNVKYRLAVISSRAEMFRILKCDICNLAVPHNTVKE